MSVGYSKEFNDATRPGFSPEAAEAAMRRLRDSELIQEQQAFQRQISGAAADAGEIASAAGARRQMTEDADRQERERKEQVDRQILLANLEDRLEAQYGEHFAENLFADLLEEGLIEQDEYAQIMAIADEDERRIAIAAAIQRGIDEGRIDPDDLDGHPWAQEWLGEHRAAAAVRNSQEAELRNGQRAIHDARVDAQEVASEGISSAEQEVFDTSMTRQENENEVSQSVGPGGGFSPV